MNIGILTHYNVNNQGAQLQMYALKKQIESMGHNVYILTYNKNFDFVDEGIKKRNIVSISSIPYFIKEFLIKKGLKLTYFNYKKYIKNKKFRNDEFMFKNYATANVDIAIVGSDEALSIDYGANMMMYGHCVDSNKLILYAPSFGQTNIEIIKKHNAVELISSGLKKFEGLGVRDENTLNLVENLTGEKATLVCDPVLLYNFEKTHTKVKLPRKKYIIIYAYDKNMTDKYEIKAIKDYAKKKGLITLSVGTYHKWCDKNISCNCLEWIEYFRNAEEIITDTFHGTITAIIAQKPLAVFIRDEINKNKLSFLIKQLGLEDRKIENINLEELEKIFSKNQDYIRTNDLLLQLRKHSNEYLRKFLGDA